MPTAKAVKIWKPFDVSFFLLGSNVEVTPNPREEFTFMQAGLGKRTVSVDSDISHVEVLFMLKQVHCLIACVIKGSVQCLSSTEISPTKKYFI